MTKKKTSNVIIFCILCLLVVAFLTPIFFVLINSFKGKLFISNNPFALPTAETFVGLTNYVNGIEKTGFFTAFGWSAFITVFSVAAIILFTSMTAYYLTRVKTGVANVLYYMFVFSMIVPFQMVMFTMSKLANMTHLNNPPGMVLLYLGFGSGLSVFMFCGFIKSIPLDIEEAAMIDGCNPLQTFFGVVMPILKPTAITVAILNAKRFDSTYPYEHLSGCGVGFKFMQAFAVNNGIEFHQLTPLLDLVAVSIASDIVPIMGENRVLAYHGLRQLNSNPSIGLKAIIDVCGLADREITMSDIVFKIGPRINASGRIQNGKKAVDLLIEKDFQSALEKSNQINQFNETRKDLDKTMTEEANKIVDHLENLSERRSIVIYNEAWHKGVIGIVASRLTEIYYRPAVVLTRTDNLATGSARSVSGFDVYKAIENCRDLLENFGGHTYAAGLSMKIENVPEFTRRFEQYVTDHILPEQTSATIDIDAQLDFRDITPKFFFDLKKFNPFGPDNPKPVFATLNVYDYGTSKVVGRDQEHIKLELVDNKSNNVMNGIAFGQSSQARYIKTKQSFNICYTIEENTHKRGEIQLQIEDIKPSFQ